jgi:hypothetical protein
MTRVMLLKLPSVIQIWKSKEMTLPVERHLEQDMDAIILVLNGKPNIGVATNGELELKLTTDKYNNNELLIRRE